MRYAIAAFWRLWVRGEVSNAMVLVQLKDGRWQVLSDAYDPNPVRHRRMPAGVGRLRDFEGRA